MGLYVQHALVHYSTLRYSRFNVLNADLVALGERRVRIGHIHLWGRGGDVEYVGVRKW